MKRASIFCGAVIVLLLFAGKAAAQINPNARVVVHSSILCGGCNVQIVARNMTPPYTEIDTVYQSGNACLDSDTSFSAIGFSIDTNLKKIYGLNLTAVTYHPNTSFPCLNGSAYVSDILHVNFDSIAYRDSSGSFVAQGVFSCSIKDSVIATGGSLHWDCNGTCTEDWVAVDTLTVKITPFQLGVSEQSIIPNFTLIVNGEEVAGKFQISDKDRYLRLIDFLGRAQNILIPEDVCLLQVAYLPPGCYFARLGDQVAKFVVPPR